MLFIFNFTKKIFEEYSLRFEEKWEKENHICKTLPCSPSTLED